MFLFIRIRPNVNLNKMNRLTLGAGKSIISNQKYIQERLIIMTSNVRRITYIALFTAVICIISQLPGIPLPGGVPMTLQTLIIPIAGIVLGPADGFIAALLYLILGMIGLPVFSGFTAGIGILMGATGGFLVSFPLMPLLAGLGDRAGENLSGKNTKSLLRPGLRSGAELPCRHCLVRGSLSGRCQPGKHGSRLRGLCAALYTYRAPEGDPGRNYWHSPQEDAPTGRAP